MIYTTPAGTSYTEDGEVLGWDTDYADEADYDEDSDDEYGYYYVEDNSYLYDGEYGNEDLA